MQKPTDELLVAYLDGELDERRCREIEAWLEQDASARERVAQLTESAAVLRAAFDEVLREEVPERLLIAARGAGEAAQQGRAAEIIPFRGKRLGGGWTTYRRWWVAVPIAASLVGLMVGGGLGYFGIDREAAPALDDKQAAAISAATNSWLDNVAEYHKLFVNAAGDSSFADIPAKDGDGGGEVIQKISQRTAQQGVRVPDLKPWGLVFQGARVVVIGGHPAAQLIYTADNKTVGKAIGPLTVLIGSTKRPDVAPTFDHRQDENLLYWHRKGHDYVIVGQADIGYMWGLANDIAWQLDAI
jgi:anti-sigma factor RsiW